MNTLKLDKTGLACFNGEWFTNSHMAYKPQHGSKLADKGMQTLIDIGTKFTNNRCGTNLETGEDINLPSIESVIPKTTYGIAVMTDKGRYNSSTKTWAIEFEVEGCDEPVYVAEKYARFVMGMNPCEVKSSAEQAEDAPVSSLVAYDVDGQMIALVMGMRIE